MRRVGESVNGRRCASLLLRRVAFVYDRDLLLDRIAEGGYNLGEFIRLVEAVVTFFRGREREVKFDLVVAGREFEVNVTGGLAVIAAAPRNLAGVFDGSDYVGSPCREHVQKLLLLNVVFLAHFLFLNVDVLKDVGFLRRTFSELGKAEQSRRDNVATRKCRHRFCLLSVPPA